MKLPYSKTLLASGLALLLTACGGSDVDKKPAKQIYEEASTHLYADNAQYNFAADVRLDGGEAEPMLANVKITINGAMDNAKGRLEMTPEVKAAMFQVSLPMSLDFKQKQLMFDPATLIEAAQMFAPGDTSALNRYNGKFIRIQPDNFSLDNEQKEQLDKALKMLDEGFSLFSQTQQESIALVEDRHFRKLELDDFAKQNKSAAVIHFSMSAEDQLEHSRKVAKLLTSKVENSANFAEFKDDVIEVIDDVLGEGAGEAVGTTLYINGKGQITHMKGQSTQNIDGKQLKLDMKIDLSNYGKAKFNIAPKASDIIDLNEEEIMRLQQAAAHNGLQ